MHKVRKKKFYRKQVAQPHKLCSWSFVGAQFRRIKDRRLKEAFDQVRSFRTKKIAQKRTDYHIGQREQDKPR